MTDSPVVGTVLVVDDDDELRFILGEHMRALGFDMLEANDGPAALELAIERIPDLIIMDVSLPSLDGVAATHALRSDARTASIPVIMLTGRTQTADIVRGLEAGAQEYVLKPFDMAELLARVQTVFRLANTRKDLDKRNITLTAQVDVKTRRMQLLCEFMSQLNQADSRDQILDLSVACVQNMTGAQRISLFALDATGKELVCERGVGIDRAYIEPIDPKTVTGVVGQVLHSGKTLAARAFGAAIHAPPDYKREAFLSTPLISTSAGRDDRVIGVLNVTEREDAASFCDEEIEYIRSIASASAIALENALRRERLEQSVRILLQTVGLLAEYRDEETAEHLERVSQMARVLAREVQRVEPYRSTVTDEFIETLVQAAPMHDIGKVGIPDDILTKPGKLTDAEFETMKGHTEIGRRVLSRALDPAYPVPQIGMCIDIAFSHHERYDGTGYPRRLAGEDIPLAARMIALVDAYDAITSERRYSAAKSHEEAVEIIRGDSGTHFDPALVEAFLRCAKEFNQVRARYVDPRTQLEAALMP